MQVSQSYYGVLHHSATWSVHGFLQRFRSLSTSPRDEPCCTPRVVKRAQAGDGSRDGDGRARAQGGARDDLKSGLASPTLISPRTSRGYRLYRRRILQKKFIGQIRSNLSAYVCTSGNSFLPKPKHIREKKGRPARQVGALIGAGAEIRGRGSIAAQLRTQFHRPLRNQFCAQR